jgi:hypothetical protein
MPKKVSDDVPSKKTRGPCHKAKLAVAHFCLVVVREYVLYNGLDTSRKILIEMVPRRRSIIKG